MRRGCALFALSLVLAVGFAIRSHAAETRTTLGLTITILPACITSVDESTREVSEHCTFPRPYRIRSASAQATPYAVSAGHTNCGVPVRRDARADNGADCTAGHASIVTVIYY